MSGPLQPIDVVPQLVHDIVTLVRLRPGALLRLPTSPCWGLALTRLGSALWVAISVTGCARIAASRRPWVQARAQPDFGQLAALLAARFPHAEPREMPGSFLYALDEASGPCGRAVILAQASAERFPWMVEGTALPLAPAAAVGPLAEGEWQELCASGAQEQDDLVSGGALPGADDAQQFFSAALARCERVPLHRDEGRSRVRAALLAACAQERQRLSVLRRAWPAQQAFNPYAEPSWLAAADAEQEIDAALSRLSGAGEVGADAAEVHLQPLADAGTAAHPRRPSAVPTIRPATALGSERQPSGDERTGAG
jgi:hypothetical protein